VFDIGIDTERLEAAQFAEIETRIAVLEVPAATGAHLTWRVAEHLDNLLARELVVGIQHHNGGAPRLGSAQSWHVDDIGIWMPCRPLFDGRQRRSRTPFSIALPDRLLAASRHNGKPGTPHWRRVSSKYRLHRGIGL
jgi:hypothetical protein